MIRDLVIAGLAAVWDYVALHVVTCLIPAFLLAGAMVSFVSKEAIVAHLGPGSGRWRSFGLAALGSFFIAACSCTVIPVASGLYYGGSGVGPAFIVLWVAPAANILALTYTGALLGGRMAALRLLLALAMAMVVGAVMTWAFRREERTRLELATGGAPPGSARRPGSADVDPTAGARAQVVSRRSAVLLALLAASLLAPNYVVQSGPYLYKVLVWLAMTAVVAVYAVRSLPREQLTAWLHETAWFVRLVFPTLIVGVFAVGVIGELLSETWVQRWLGGDSPRSALAAALVGAVSYFATMTEAPFVSRLMELGMGKGPALALLLTGPGLSLPNMLAIARVFGVRKAAVYVGLLVALATLGGWIAGAWLL